MIGADEMDGGIAPTPEGFKRIVLDQNGVFKRLEDAAGVDSTAENYAMEIATQEAKASRPAALDMVPDPGAIPTGEQPAPSSPGAEFKAPT